jgi:DNA-directed RNA polymerase subunit RPC12/RpoP
MRCANCGAPITTDSRALPDFRTCPTCHRKLLALGSPACNYCGRRLPDEYIRAREADLKRITEVAEKENPTGLAGEIRQFFSDTRRRNRRESFSALGSVDITSLIDFFS